LCERELVVGFATGSLNYSSFYGAVSCHNQTFEEIMRFWKRKDENRKERKR
jgi:hypothetical protein